MADKIGWGILATGHIAHSFVQDLKTLADATITAVGSRNPEKARNFAKRYGIGKFYGSYQELASDPDVDVIYIATPHSSHYENTMMCLKNGKHVLCEKPLAVNAREAREMIELAREKNLFLMEGMWNRYHPVVKDFVKMIREGLIGGIELINADLCIQAAFDPHHRLFDKQLAGGALLDLGIYPVAFSYLLMGQPDFITSAAKIGETGVDEQCGIIFTYKSGCLAQLFASVRIKTPSDAVVVGGKGRMRLHGPLYRPSGLTISLPGKPDQHIPSTMEGNGFQYEASEVMDCLRHGRTESADMTLDESLRMMRTMDAIRHPWGLVYANDERSGV